MNRKTVLLLAVISFVVHHFWLTNLSLLTAGDTWIYHFQQSLDFLMLPSMWINDPAWFGNVNVMHVMYPLNVLRGIIAFLGFHFNVSVRILFLWPIAILSVINMYFLAKKIFKSHISIITATIAYNYNTCMLYKRTDQLDLTMVMMLAPILLYLFMLILEKRSYYLSVCTGLLMFIASFYELRILYILAWILVFYTVYFLLFIQKTLKPNEIVKTIFYASVPFILVFLLNFYWLLPLWKLGLVTSNEIFDQGLFGNSFLNILYALTLRQPFWTGGPIAFFENQPIPAYAFLLPLMAFIGLLVNKNNKYVPFFGVIAVIGIFITKQVGVPFGDVYQFLYDHLIGFNAFREATKFFFVTALGYAILVSGFVDWLWTNWRKTKEQKIITTVITVGVLFFFLLNTKPFITREIGTLFVPRKIAEDYDILYQFTAKQNDFFRTYWLPYTNRWGVFTNLHQLVPGTYPIENRWKDIFGYDNKNGKISQEKMLQVIQSPEFYRLLTNTSIKYIVVPLHDNMDDIFITRGDDRLKYIATLDKVPYIAKIDIGTKELAIYQNKIYKPHIYLTAEPETFKKLVPAQALDYKKNSLTEYNVSLNSISKPVYLNFNDQFHPDWKVRAGEFNIWQVYAKNYFIPDGNHIKNDFGFNTFKIDPGFIRTLGKDYYSENPDKSININITLNFYSQTMLYISSMVSLSILVITVIYLIVKYPAYAKKQ